ncbi:MAG: hypothetical protein KGV50_04705 [Gammaproteobacteria bacterium]|nr:hypothetical protein [Gammaproteobacteria bacterium]
MLQKKQVKNRGTSRMLITSFAKITLTMLFLLGVSGNITFASEKKVEIEFLTNKQSAQFLSEEDEYLKNMSVFDMQFNFNASSMPSKQEITSHFQDATKNWTPEYKLKVQSAIDHLNKKIKDLNLRYPQKVKFILMDKGAAGAAAYTRSNAIIWPEDFMLMDTPLFNRIIAHEFFHVYSRYNKADRDKLYAPLHYQKTAPLTLPAELQDLRVTNPDTPILNQAIMLEYKGKKQWFMPVLIAKKPYDSTVESRLYKYIINIFIAVTLENNIPTVVHKDQKPILVGQKETNFIQYVQPNTEYLLGPEEISAENFSLWVSDNSAEIYNQKPIDALIEAMKKID